LRHSIFLGISAGAIHGVPVGGEVLEQVPAAALAETFETFAETSVSEASKKSRQNCGV
jgi:hypothetical protein